MQPSSPSTLNFKFYTTGFKLAVDYVLVGMYYAWLAAKFVLIALEPYYFFIGIAAVIAMVFIVHRMRN